MCMFVEFDIRNASNTVAVDRAGTLALLASLLILEPSQRMVELLLLLLQAVAIMMHDETRHVRCKDKTAEQHLFAFS